VIYPPTDSRAALGREHPAYTSVRSKKGKGSPYSISECMVPELIPVLCSQPAGDLSHKPGGRLPLLSARPAINLATLKRAATNFAVWCTMGVDSLPKSVTRLRRGCDLNPGPTAPESNTLTTRLPSHPRGRVWGEVYGTFYLTLEA